MTFGRSAHLSAGFANRNENIGTDSITAGSRLANMCLAICMCFFAAVMPSPSSQLAAQTLEPASPKGGKVREMYPSWALKEGAMAAAVVSVWVDAKGNVYQCDILEGLGNEKLASEICTMRGFLPKFRPARDASGDRMFGNVVSLMTVAIPGTKLAEQLEQVKRAPDVLVSVPEELTQSIGTTFSVEVLVDTDGLVDSCTWQDGVDRALAVPACDQLLGIDFLKGENADGEPVAYVRSLLVGFSKGDTSASTEDG